MNNSHTNFCKGCLICLLDSRYPFRKSKAVSVQVLPCVFPKHEPGEPIYTTPLLIPCWEKSWDSCMEVQGSLCTVLTYVILLSLSLSFSVSFLIWLLRDRQVMEKKLKGKIQGKCKWKEVIITVIMKCLSFKYKNVTLKWTCDPEMHF